MDINKKHYERDYMISQKQGFWLTGWPWGTLRQVWHWPERFKYRLQILKDAEDEDKKWEILDFYLRLVYAASMRKEQRGRYFCPRLAVPGMMIWVGIMQSQSLQRQSRLPLGISSVTCRPAVLNSSRMGACLVSSLEKKPVVWRSEHTRSLFPWGDRTKTRNTFVVISLVLV